jgi:hypothetical protein
VSPGVYLLSAAGAVELNSLPSHVGRVGMTEFVAPAPDSVMNSVTADAAPEYVRGQPMIFRAQVAASSHPDSVALFIRPLGRSWFSRYPMTHTGGYDFQAEIPGDSLREGPHQYMVTVAHGATSVTYPEGIQRRPWDWDFSARRFWTTNVVAPAAPLVLFRPADDVGRMAFTRIGDAGRQGIFRVTTPEITGEPAFHFELPVNNDWSPEDYTASITINDRIAARGSALGDAKAVVVRLRGVGVSQTVHLTLVERDGTGWSVPVTVDRDFVERTIPLSDFKIARGVMLPQGFPGQWLYWLPPASGRGGSGDRLRIGDVERLQISLRPPGEGTVKAGEYGVEIEKVMLVWR